MGPRNNKKQNKKSPLAIQNAHFLKFFSKIGSSRRSRLIPSLNKPHVQSISEVCENFLKSNVPCTLCELKKLYPYREELRTLSSKKLSLKKKKNLMTTRRGGALLSVLLPLAIGAITTLLSNR